jgi:hypothetical protein
MLKISWKSRKKWLDPLPVADWIWKYWLPEDIGGPPTLIIWNIDIHTCLLDSTFLCPHLLIINNLFFAKIKVAPFGFHSCIFWKFYLFVIKLNDSIVDVGGPPMGINWYFYYMQLILCSNDNVFRSSFNWRKWTWWVHHPYF